LSKLVSPRDFCKQEKRFSIYLNLFTEMKRYSQYLNKNKLKDTTGMEREDGTYTLYGNSTDIKTIVRMLNHEELHAIIDEVAPELAQESNKHEYIVNKIYKTDKLAKKVNMFLKSVS